MSEKLNPKLTQFKQLFEQKKFDEAIVELKSLRLDIDPGLYEFNLATIYLKKEDFFNARKYFEKAKDLGFLSNETQAGLEKSKELLEVKLLEAPMDFQSGIEKMILTSSLELFVVVSLLLGMPVLIGRLNKYLRVSFLILSFIPISFYYKEVKQYSRLIATDTILVLEGPSRMFEEVQVLPRGMVFIVKEKVEGWLKVQYPKSHIGWIKNSKTEKL